MNIRKSKHSKVFIENFRNNNTIHFCTQLLILLITQFDAKFKIFWYQFNPLQGQTFETKNRVYFQLME